LRFSSSSSAATEASPRDAFGARVVARLYASLGSFAGLKWRRFVIVAALALAVPSAFCGFALDDYVLLHELAHPSGNEWAGRAPFDLFRWIEPSHDPRASDGAGLPWWTFEQAKLSFLRPVSSLTHALDHALWPRSAVMMHLHNLFWFAVLLVLASRLYAGLIESRWAAGVATAMYALDSTHAYPIGWISNRNALIGGVFGVATLLLHHSYRQSRSFGAALAAWLCFAMSLLSVELALAVPGYLLAYALCLERGCLLPRIAPLVPYAVLTVAWAIARSALGYGSFGIGAYVDPIVEPAAFLQQVPVRAILLMSSQVSLAMADLFDHAPPELRSAMIAWGILVCTAVLWFAWPTLRARRPLRFFALGSALSLLPLTATLPNDRLLVLTGVGVMPVLAQGLHDVFSAMSGTAPTLRGGASSGTEPALRGGASRARRALPLPRALVLRSAFGIGLVLAHLVVDPLVLPWIAVSPRWLAGITERVERALPADPAVAAKTVIVAAVPDSLLLTYLPTIRSYSGRPRPRKLYWLAATPGSTRFERRAPNVLRVTAPSGLFDRRWEARSPRFALRPGERVRVAAFTVEVVAVTSDRRPAVCDFVFDEPLDSPRYLWRVWQDDDLIAFKPPPPGRTVTMRGTDRSVPAAAVSRNTARQTGPRARASF
jgi:hypothetical protein